jgi:hypothetical protein
MGTFIVSFIGHSFVQSALDTQPLRWLSPDVDAQRRILVVAFFTIILAFITCACFSRRARALVLVSWASR